MPAPSLVLRSSPEKYQALWNVDGEDWTAGQAELYSHLLAARYGGDEVVTPATQVMRVPGFRNAKQEYRSESGSPVVDEVELSRRLWPVRPRAKLDVDRFRPLEGVVGVEALRRGLEKWVGADRSLGVSPAKVGEAESRAAEMAHENEAWRLRLRAASARAGVVLPARMRGTVPEVPDARFSAGWPGRAVGPAARDGSGVACPGCRCGPFAALCACGWRRSGCGRAGPRGARGSRIARRALRQPARRAGVGA